MIRHVWILFLLNVMLWGMIKLQLTSTEMDLVPLLQTHRYVIDNLEVIIDEKKTAFCFVTNELKRYKLEYKEAKTNITAYIENPINKFTFLKRLSADLEWLEKVINKSTGTHKDKSVKYPTQKDMYYASLRLQRLQSIYQLSVTQLADGLLHTRYGPDRKYYTEHFSPLTVEDCYETGRSMYVIGALREGVSWMLEAYRKLGKGNSSPALTKSKIIWAICQGYNGLDDNLNFIIWAEKLVDMKALNKNDQADLLVKIDMHRLRMSRKEWKTNEDTDPKDEVQDKKTDIRKLKCTSEAESTGEYSKLCRGESLIDPEIAKRLKCWYFSGHHPYMLLGPMKVEQLHMKPNVFMFHQAINDNEIEIMKHLAEDQLKKNQINKNITLPRNRYVSGKVMFLPKKVKILDQVTRRMEDLSGLNQNWSDPWQVNYYGVGGHCKLHHDFWQSKDSKTNNRLATVLFYLSDVIQGGATVFYNLGLAVYPVKGAALFWKNLRVSGAGNNLLCHGACPVLRGSKWLATKWIYRYNQELRQPCVRKYKKKG